MIQQFNYPTTILYGSGATAELASRLAALKAGPYLFVTDPGIVRAGLADHVEGVLRKAGVVLERDESVHPNPVEDDVLAGVAAYKKAKANGIIALGGGSPMDVAKAIAVLATHDGPLSRFDDSKGGDRFITHPLPPIYAIPTTAGTGSEVGRSGVIITKDTGVKTIIFHPTLLPRIAVLDPQLTAKLPAGLTAATGMDAFTHGLEAYISKGFHPIADAMALGCMELAIEALPRAVANGDDLDARGRMLLSASMGAAAFQKGLGVIHSLAHPLSTLYGIHHGLANALLIEPTLTWQLNHKKAAYTDDLKQRYVRVVRMFTGKQKASPADLPHVVAEMNARLGIKDTLATQGLKVKDIPKLAAEAFADPCHGSNPIPITPEDMAELYHAALR